MENIIVGVVFDNQFSWYITDKNLWFLDYNKVIYTFEKRGFNINIEYIDDKRKNFIVLDTENAGSFLAEIEINKVTSYALNYNLIKSETIMDDTWKYDYRPSLYINFDEKVLYSNYSESGSFEDYVPHLWLGKYQIFDDFIPQNQKYWLDSNNENLLN